VIHVGPGVCILTPEQLARALALRDLADEAQGVHTVHLLVRQLVAALQASYGLAAEVHRGSRIVSVEDNYDRLYYPPDGAARDSRYTRYVGPRHVLRKQMTAAIPGALHSVPPGTRDRLLLAPGIVYRRDRVDRLHCGEPPQMDVWLLCRRRVGRQDLLELIDTILQTAVPGRGYRTVAAAHPYTVRGLQVDILDQGNYTKSWNAARSCRGCWTTRACRRARMRAWLWAWGWTGWSCSARA
jgi:phenylalanyl-tRNA synthetase alpha chain